MKQTRWTKKGVEMKKKCKPMKVSTGPERHFKGGAHTPDTAYNRSDKKKDEREVKRGNYE